MKITRAIVLTDLHLPYTDFKSLNAVEKFMAEYKFDYYLNLGDLIDFDYISKYNEANKRGNENKRIQKDYILANDLLDRHQALIKKNNPKAKFVLLEGNHDYRVERFIDKEPMTEGYFEMEAGLNLKKRGFKWVRENEVYKLGKARFIHGKYTSKNHAFKHVDNYGFNIFYGHLHDIQSFSKIQYGDDSTIVGQSIGCLCNYDQKYLRGNPTNWAQSFALFEFLPNGNFFYNVVRIINHQFIYNGKLYA